MRRLLLTLIAPPLLLGLAACGPEEPTEEETGTPTIQEPSTEDSQSVEVSDGGGEGLGEVVQPTETTEYVEQGEDHEDG